MTEFEYWPLVAAATLVVASVAHHRLIKAAQPLRLELAEKGERLIAHPGLPKHMQSQVRFLLDRAFNMRGVLLFGLVLVPVIALIAIVRPTKFLSFVDQTKIKDETANSDFIEFRRLHDRITLANHPLLLLLLEFEIVLFMPLGILVVGLVCGRVPLRGDRDAVMSAIEMKKSTVFGHNHVRA